MIIIKILITIAYGLLSKEGLLYSIKACTDKVFGLVGPNSNGTSYAPKENANIMINEDKILGVINGKSI